MMSQTVQLKMIQESIRKHLEVLFKTFFAAGLCAAVTGISTASAEINPVYLGPTVDLEPVQDRVVDWPQQNAEFREDEDPGGGHNDDDDHDHDGHRVT